MVIDLKEIVDNHEFENFCMHLLEDMGLVISVQPALGPDGGRDIICEESSRFGHRGYRWLVSCKHYAHSRRSVGVKDDAAVANKLIEHGCNGFMFFFSTPFTEGFRASVDGVCNQINSQYVIFNSYEIERTLLSSPIYYPLIRQYFPASHDRLVSLKNTEGCCSYCGPQDALYAVYTRNSEKNEISYQVFGEFCIEYFIEYLNESGVEYGVSKIRSAAKW